MKRGFTLVEMIAVILPMALISITVLPSILNQVNNKKEEIKVLADNIKDNNNETLKNINGDYYFTGKDVNNYIKYSNIIFRIIKINKDDIDEKLMEHAGELIAKGELVAFPTETRMFDTSNR